MKTINAFGIELLDAWLKKTAKSEQDALNWLTVAEEAASNAPAGESAVVIEMRQWETQSGHTEVLYLPQNAFDEIDEGEGQ
jgi:hypothetical protein